MRLWFAKLIAFNAGRRDAAPAKKFERAGTRRPKTEFPYAEGTRERAKTVCAQIVEWYQQKISSLAARYRKEATYYDAVLAPQLTDRKSARDAAKAKVDSERSQWLERKDGAADAPANVLMTYRIYPFFLIGLAIFEMPFNLMVMQVMNENLFLTFILALGISVLVPALGHMIGKEMRIGDYRLALVGVAAGLGLLLASAYFRMTYLADVSRHPANMRTMIAFLAFGVVFLAVSTFASRYSESAEDEYAPRRVVNAKREFRIASDCFEVTRTACGRAQQEVQGIDEIGRRLQSQFESDIHQEIHAHNMILEAYWRGLQREWDDSPYPESADFQVGEGDVTMPALWPPPYVASALVAGTEGGT